MMNGDSNDALSVYGLGGLVNPARSIPGATEVERTFTDSTSSRETTREQHISATEEFQRRIAAIESASGVSLGESSRVPADDDDDDDRDRERDREHDDDFAPRSEPSASTPSTYAPQRAAPSQPSIQLSPEGVRYTQEAMKSDRMSSALSALSINPESYISIEHENDEKLSLIEEINELISVFRDSGEDVSTIHVSTIDEPIEAIRANHRSLLHRNDRKRYGSIADDCIMLIATSIAQIFNGKREYFGFRPNLSGWPQHMMPKLRRMRHDTSQMTSSLFNNYNIGVGGRIFLELVPSMIMYARDHSTTAPSSAPTSATTDPRAPEAAPEHHEVDFANALNHLSATR